MGDSRQRRADTRFDVFKLGPDGSLQWIGDSEFFSGAMFRVELAAAKAPGKYVLHNQKTGERWLLNYSEHKRRIL
jgi:hypothetical protein